MAKGVKISVNISTLYCVPFQSSPFLIIFVCSQQMENINIRTWINDKSQLLGIQNIDPSRSFFPSYPLVCTNFASICNPISAWLTTFNLEMSKYKSGWMEFEEATYLSDLFQQIVSECRVSCQKYLRGNLWENIWIEISIENYFIKRWEKYWRVIN